MGWKDILEFPGKFLANGGHAQQDIPSQHRLLNAGGMFAGWWMMDQMRHIVFGVKMKSEGEYVEIKREDVPAALRFLHKSIDWDPLSETPEHQWKKLAYQLFPGVGAGLGATAGSIYAFQRNGREQLYKGTKTQQALSLLDADFAAQYAQSTPLRLLAAFFGTFSAASGLTFMYGFFLNPAFASANGAKIFAGSLAKGNLAPHKAVPAQLEALGSYVQEAVKTGKVSNAWAAQFAERILQPLFGHELKSPEAQAQAVKTLQGIVEESYQKFNVSGKPAKEIAEAVTKDLSAKLGKGGIEKTLKTHFGLDAKKAKVGNANPLIWQFQNFLASMGLAKAPTAAVHKTTASAAFPLGAAATALGTTVVIDGMGSKKAMAADHGQTLSTTETPLAPDVPATPTETTEHKTPIDGLNTSKHMRPDATGKTLDEYVRDAVTMHKSQYEGKGKSPPALLKWMGDAQLAVLPSNRLYSAIGLTTGLMVAGNMAKIATGYGLDGKAVDAAKVPTFLQGMKGIVKDYTPGGLRPRDRWIKYAQWGVYSLGGLAGIKLGTGYAYKNVKEKNKDPHYIEDYLPRISMHQGETWSWLASVSGILGSASGMWLLPVPGINYGLSLAARATSMQDRNFMLGGLNEVMSGATTTSFLRLREGVNYLCHYAVGNPAEHPAQIEYLAYTLLGPIFKDQLTVEHIQRFTEAVHEVRDQFWQEGGIPKEKRKEALRTMREVFTGPGLEVLLIDMGLNPGTIAFSQLNGVMGRIGNVGISNKIQVEQNAYQKGLEGRLEIYMKQGLISQERADWVRAGIESIKHREKQAAPAPQAQETTPAPVMEAAPSATFTEKAPQKNSIETLIKRSEKPDDWREAARLSKENLAPAAVGG